MAYKPKVLSPKDGGTGIANNAASTITISGAFGATFTLTNTTSVTFPTSGTLATTASIPSLPLSVSNGGTGASNSGTTGKVLIGNGSSAFVESTPSFPNASATAGKFIRSDGTNWIASTPTLPTSAGTSGKVLQSNGTNYVESTPTYPSTSGTSRKILVSDGTNNVYSTETWAVPGTSGNVLTSDGTNWTSAASATGTIATVTKTLTNAQIKALHGTPIQFLAAPGAGKVIVPISIIGKMIYGGTNAFTAAAAQTVNVMWGTGASAATIIQNGMITATSSQYNIIAVSLSAPGAITLFENLAINLYNPQTTEITGNAANNNTMSFSMVYYIVTL